MGQGLLDDRRGWLTVWGDFGTGKSLLGAGLVADFCRQGSLGLYRTGGGVSQALFADISGDGVANFDRLARADALVIDEFSTAQISSDWLARRLRDLLEDRYRRADHQVTVLIMNDDPDDFFLKSSRGGAWADLAPALYSRIHDGRFSRPWVAGMEQPDMLAGHARIPGVLPVLGPDMRPLLRWGDR